MIPKSASPADSVPEAPHPYLQLNTLLPAFSGDVVLGPPGYLPPACAALESNPSPVKDIPSLSLWSKLLDYPEHWQTSVENFFFTYFLFSPPFM